MKLNNHSRCPTSAFLPVLRWMAKRIPDAARLTLIELTDGDDDFARRHCVATGEAFTKVEFGNGWGEKYLVAVHIPPNLFTGRQYPRASRYPGGPVVIFQNWHEEVVHTLAHEFRHIAQFEAGYTPKTAEEDDARAEVDAETFALKVLEQYRGPAGFLVRARMETTRPTAAPEKSNVIYFPTAKKKLGTAMLIALAACGHAFNVRDDRTSDTMTASVSPPSITRHIVRATYEFSGFEAESEAAVESAPLKPRPVKRLMKLVMPKQKRVKPAAHALWSERVPFAGSRVAAM
jgi:hypothetical protein